MRRSIMATTAYDLNVCYLTGRIVWVPPPGEADGKDFVLHVDGTRNGRVPCWLSRRRKHRRGTFRIGDRVFVQGPVFGDGINGQLGMKVVFVRFIHPRRRRPAREAEEAVVGLARSAGRVTRREVAARLGLSTYQAAYILARLVRAGRLRRVGRGRGAWYELVA
jgi:hypothetical protein